MGPLLHALLDLVYAPICLGCDGAIHAADGTRLVCRRCRARLRRVPHPLCARCGAPRLRTGRRHGPRCDQCEGWPDALRWARSAFLLEPPADRLVHRLKYGGWRALAGPMGALLASAMPTSGPEPGRASCIIPVPTTRRRLRERGYNQAAELAGAFALRVGRRVAHALERQGAQASQTTLQPAARGANVAGAFRVADGARPRLAGTDVLLVDDVLTTGATVAECVRTLADAGVRSVGVVTFARAARLPRRTDG